MLRLVLLLAGVGLFVLLVLQLGADHIATMLRGVGWGFFGVLLFYAAHQLSRAAALWASVPDRPRVSYWDTLRIRLAGEAVRFLTLTGPFLAEPAKVWLFKQRGLDAVEGAAATITEYIAYTLLSTAMSIGALAYLLAAADPGPVLATIASTGLTALVVGAVAMSVAFARGCRPLTALVRAVGRTGTIGARVQRHAGAVRRFEDRLRQAFRGRPRRLVRIGAIEAVAQAFLVGEAYWILRTLDLSFPPGYPVLIEAAAKFNAAFFVVPARVGTAEATYALMFDLLGLTATAGFTMAFVRRARTLLVAGAGLLALSRLTPTRGRHTRVGSPAS